MEIKATVIQDSVSNGQRIVTVECEYPRFIHSEVMTHRVFSRNAASSRAIPIDKMLKQVEEDPASPIHWGANQAGMQADNQVSNIKYAQDAWKMAAVSAAHSARQLQRAGLHKQIVNRVLEPFQMMKTIITATDWDNFFELRMHKDAQPEIKVLAECIYNAMQNSTPFLLHLDEWHVPYVNRYRCPEYGNLIYELHDDDLTELTKEQAIKVSASCCAQVSYRLLDDSLEKAEMIYDRLVTAKPIHASPFEHQASPTLDPKRRCGNFKGFIQNRQIIEEQA